MSKGNSSVPLREYTDCRVADLQRQITAAGADLTKQLERLDKDSRERADRLQVIVDELRIGAATHLSRDAFDAFANRLGDDLADYPSKIEVRGQLDAVTLTVGALNEKVNTALRAADIAQERFITRDSFDAYQRTQEENRASAKRAIQGAIVAAGLALIGWGISAFLTFAHH